MKVGTDGVLLGAWADGGKRILDIGTGTGLVAIMMAQRFPDSHITAIEIDINASEQAKENVEASPFADRIKVNNCSLQEFFDDNLFDSIVCNPPFFEENLKSPNERRNMARHTDTLPYSFLISSHINLLSENGTGNLIIPADYLHKLEKECAYCSLFITEKLFIKTTERKAPKRVLVKIRKKFEPCTTREEVLMSKADRSSWYAQLTEDFYL